MHFDAHETPPNCRTSNRKKKKGNTKILEKIENRRKRGGREWKKRHTHRAVRDRNVGRDVKEEEEEGAQREGEREREPFNTCKGLSLSSSRASTEAATAAATAVAVCGAERNPPIFSFSPSVFPCPFSVFSFTRIFHFHFHLCAKNCRWSAPSQVERLAAAFPNISALNFSTHTKKEIPVRCSRNWWLPFGLFCGAVGRKFRLSASVCVRAMVVLRGLHIIFDVSGVHLTL